MADGGYDQKYLGGGPGSEEEKANIAAFAGGQRGLIARDDARRDFRAREQGYPDLGIPTPEEVLGEVCQTCGGTTWVVRANAELKGPILAQVVPCDNPDCPQMATQGVREIIHLAVPDNYFDSFVQICATGQITALTKSEKR